MGGSCAGLLRSAEATAIAHYVLRLNDRVFAGRCAPEQDGMRVLPGWFLVAPSSLGDPDPSRPCLGLIGERANRIPRPEPCAHRGATPCQGARARLLQVTISAVDAFLRGV